jgi:hypothetical protein
MRYVSHQFAHLDTLERARRWLIQAGFDPSRIEVHTQGIPRLAVAVASGESAVVEWVIGAAESLDPDGNPSFWDLARQQHVYPQTATPSGSSAQEFGPHSFVIAWRPLDVNREVTQATTDAELQRAYRERWD